MNSFRQCFAFMLASLTCVVCVWMVAVIANVSSIDIKHNTATRGATDAHCCFSCVTRENIDTTNYFWCFALFFFHPECPKLFQTVKKLRRNSKFAPETKTNLMSFIILRL